MEYVPETKSLTKCYRSFTALAGLNMMIPKGSIYGFVGRNGAGKTTLIRLICGLQEPTTGSYTLCGIENEESPAGFYGVLSGRGIVPDIRMPERPVVRTLDGNALRRIFDNILSNAAKYSDGDLSVCLSSDGTVIFENSTGELDPVRTAHLFDRFFTVNTAKGGTGLGLSIAKILTEKMNGSISAEYCGYMLCSPADSVSGPEYPPAQIILTDALKVQDEVESFLFAVA